MKNAIEINDLNKSFKNFKLENVNFVLPEGCILGLIGENGAGKSTIINLIIDSLNADSGTINVFGKSNHELNKNDVGIVSEYFGLPVCLKINELENIAKNIFTEFNHEEFVRLCDLLKIPKDTKYKEMSTGNKMKVSIVLAMSHNAKLLIMDEPTNGLDPIVRDEVIDLLFDYTRDETHSILISSHIVSDLEKVCDYICFVHNGKILECEEKDELLNRYALVYIDNDNKQIINDKAIVKRKVSQYSEEILVDRRYLTADIKTNPISLEDLFIFMVKEKLK